VFTPRFLFAVFSTEALATFRLFSEGSDEKWGWGVVSRQVLSGLENNATMGSTWAAAFIPHQPQALNEDVEAASRLDKVYQHVRGSALA
jgi:hypothetical protein